MFPPLPLNAQSNSPEFNFNIANTAPIVPAKRKRANTSAPAQSTRPPPSSLPPTVYGQSQYAAFIHPATSSSVELAPPSSATATAAASARPPGPRPHPTQNNAPPGSGPGAGSDDIHCICGYSDDDGYTIACDDCGRWSHMVCFDISVGKDPDEWRCWECFPRPVNRERAHDRQAARVAAQIQGRLGPFVGSAEALAAGSAQQRRRRRTTGIVAHNHPPPPLSAAHSGEAAAEDEHVDIEDDWRMAYVPLTEDVIPHVSTRTKLRLAAQNWRGVTALSPDDSEVEGAHISRTKVVPVPNGKDDVAAAVRPPSYGLQTTEPIANEGLIAPFSSTIIPSASYLADPLNGYAQLGMPKPHVHLVPPPLSVALDARMAGNEARFIRSGCRPNAVLRPVLCPSKQSGDGNEPGVLKFAIFALRDLKASEEVVLSWEWDDGAVVHQLPAIIEEGLRSGAGPSKMTSHHIKRLRLQMQSIVDSLKSSFVTCACGGSARDCAVKLMEAFADGETPWLNGFHDTSRENSPRVSRIQHNPAQVGPFRQSLYDQYQSSSGSGSPPHQHTPMSQFQSPPPPSTATTITTGTNKHPTSLNSLHDLTRYVNAKTRPRPFGPLLGAERGVRTRVVGGPDSGGLKGVQQVHGDRWDRFGELEIEVNEGGGGRKGKDGAYVPMVRIEQATPIRMRQKLDLKGKGKMPGLNGVGLGLGLEPHTWSVRVGARSSSSLSSSKEATEDTEETMPPKMRKRWMKEKSEILRNECHAAGGEFTESGSGSERIEGSSPGLIMAERCLNGMTSDELGHARERIEVGRNDLRPPSAVEQQYNSMEVDSDTLQARPPPPPNTASSPVSARSTLPSSSATVPNSSTLTSSTHPQPQARRPTSLFSLLNEHPVSPIHTSNKHLATILNAVEEAVVVPSAKKAPVIPEVQAVCESRLQLKQTPPNRTFTPVMETLGQAKPEHVEEPQGLALQINGDTQMFEVVEVGLAESEPGVEAEAVTESRDVTPAIQENTPAPECIKEEAEIVALTAPSPPVEDIASRMSTPTPASPCAVTPSQMSNPGTPIRVLSPYMTSPGEERNARSPSCLLSQSRTSSPGARGQQDAVVEIHSIASSSGWKSLTAERGDESPRALFKEELMQAAVEARVQADPAASWEADVNVVAIGGEAEDDAEASEKMIVDDSLRLIGTDRLRSISPLSVPESTHDKEEIDIDLEIVDVNAEQKIVSSDVNVGGDDDEEMWDARPSPMPAHERETRISPPPAPDPVVEVQTPTPPRLAVISLSPASPPPSNEPLPHSSLLESKTSLLTPPEQDSYEEKHAILASVSPAAPDSQRDPSPEDVSMVDNRAGSADHAHLNASSGLLRAPSPTVSVDSSVDVRPTPPPFSIATSDNEHDSDQHHTQDQVQQSVTAEGTSQVTSTAAPPEPPKIRRSMADYKQRKRKQREEEAAKAALASPISPVSPLQQLLDDVNTAIDFAKSDGAPSMENGNSLAERKGLDVIETVATQSEEKSPNISEAQKILVAPETSVDPLTTVPTTLASFPMPKSRPIIVLSVEGTSQPSALPKREVSEELVDFSLSPEIDSKGLGALKGDDVPITPPRRETPQEYRPTALSPVVSSTAEPSRGAGRAPQSEDGEIQGTPARSITPPSKPRVDISPGKPPAVALSAPSSATASSFFNSQTARFGNNGPTPPTQPRSFRDGRVISASPPPRYSREPLPPPPVAAAKSKQLGGPLRDRAGFPSKEVTDRKPDAVTPITIRRASSYVPGPSQKSNPSSASSGSNAPPPTAPSGQIRPPSGPRALRGPPSGLARMQPQLPPPRGPLADRVERDRSRDRDRDRGDRERDRDRDRDRYSPPTRGRHVGRGRFWRGRR